MFEANVKLRIIPGRVDTAVMRVPPFLMASPDPGDHRGRLRLTISILNRRPFMMR